MIHRTPPTSPAPPPAAASLTTPVMTSASSLARSFSTPTPAPLQVETLRVPSNPQQLHSSSSEPNLTEKQNATLRKRKRSLCENEELQKFMLDMKLMFKDFKTEQSKKCDRICSAAEDMRSTVEFLAEKYDLLQARVEKLEVERKSDIQYIKSLEERLDGFERNSRSTCLEIRNIPASTSESKSSLLDTFLNTTKVLNVPVQQSDVKDIFRIQTKDPENRTIIVDLTSALQKEKIISKYRQFNKGSKLTTEHLHISGTARPIFISENLSSKMKKIFYLARETAKENDFKFCWVSHGKIFLRKKENGPLIRILDESDLEKAKHQK